MFYKFLLRPFLFLFSPETSHHLVMKTLKILGKIPGKMWAFDMVFNFKDSRLEKTVAGIKFPNSVGLAAGFDKDAIAYNELATFGFGFIEIGTVTPLAQDGNEKPRIFRLPKDEALINRMGFNNSGVKAVAARLRKNKRKVIVGGNIGKNKTTTNENAVNDYLICFRELYELVDYFVVNISSPNTPGLRELQEKEPLIHLLKAVINENVKGGRPKPVFLKIAPDLSTEQVDDIVQIVIETGLAGMVISNTTLSREGLKTPAGEVTAMGAGGISGKPVFERSTELVRYVASKAQKQFAIIASGGIHSSADAKSKLAAGADLVQLYTGFIYEGPGLITAINKALLKN